MPKIHEPKSSHPRDRLHHYLGDIVYGANDGIITTFTVVSGVEGAKLAPLIVIILGFVNLLADGVSMGASRYLSIRARSSVSKLDRGLLEPAYHGLCTFGAFVFFGLFPLISFLIPGLAHRFPLSCLITGSVLFSVGSLRIFVSKKRWLRGGLEMLFVGGIVAVIAYYVGYFIQGLY